MIHLIGNFYLTLSKMAPKSSKGEPFIEVVSVKNNQLVSFCYGYYNIQALKNHLPGYIKDLPVKAELQALAEYLAALTDKELENMYKRLKEI